MLAQTDLDRLLNEWADLQNQIHLKDPATLWSKRAALSDLIARMSKDIETKQTKIGVIEKRIKKEYADVERMKSVTFKSLKAKLVGKYERKLEKEEAKFVAAYEELQAEQRELESLRNSLRPWKADFDSLEGSASLVDSMIQRLREIEKLIFDGPSPYYPSEDLLEQQTKRLQLQSENLRSIMYRQSTANTYIDDAATHCRKAIKYLLDAKEFTHANMTLDAIFLDCGKEYSTDKGEQKIELCKERVEAACTIYPELRNHFPEETFTMPITKPSSLFDELFGNDFKDYHKIKKSLKKCETVVQLLTQCKTNMESSLESLKRDLAETESLHAASLKQLEDTRKDILVNWMASKKTYANVHRTPVCQ